MQNFFQIFTAVFVTILFFTQPSHSQNRSNSGETPYIFENLIRYSGDNCELTTCNPFDHYRSYNGSCNNLQNPCWGMRFRTHNRLMVPDYGNGINSFRKAAPGTPTLPNPRLVSRTVHTYDPIESRQVSSLFVGWGQFVDHDFTNTQLESGTQNSANSGPCNGDIYIPPGDKVFESPGCMTYTASLPVQCLEGKPLGEVTCGCTSACLPGQAQQINRETSFIDASGIYGKSLQQTQQLKDNGSAFLKTGKYDLPPKTNNSGSYVCESLSSQDQRCFNMGTDLNNQNVYLIALQTLFIREHNRLVTKLQSRFQNQNQLYEEVRKMVGAMIQNIVYSEQLPVLLGNCRSPELKVPTSSDYQYNPDIDPQTTVECITSACRYGHTEMQGNLKLYRRPRYEDIKLTKMFSLDLFSRNDSIELIIGGALEQQSKSFDHYFDFDSANRMSTPFWKTYVDIVSTDITRGRNHGLPGYVAFRQYCGLSVPLTYDDLLQLMPSDVVYKLRELYGENGIENIDLLTAGVSEYRDLNCTSRVGPTYSCILTEHYRRLKRGDRFWFENQGFPNSFTTEQIEEIRKTTLAGVICQNSQLPEVQESVLLLPSSTNLIQTCGDIRKKTEIDLTLWAPN